MMCDYDADIAMQREECEKFRKVVNEENLSIVIFETIIKIRCILGNTKKWSHLNHVTNLRNGSSKNYCKLIVTTQNSLIDSE